MAQPEFIPRSESPMVIVKVHKSRWFLFLPLVITAATGVILIIILFALAPIFNPLLQIALVIAIVLGFGLAAFVIWVDWVNTFYVLTDQTVEKVSGFMTRSRTYVSLYDLSKVHCSSGILGKIFDFGELSIESETAERTLRLIGVPSPYQIQDLIRQARAHVAPAR